MGTKARMEAAQVYIFRLQQLTEGRREPNMYQMAYLVLNSV